MNAIILRRRDGRRSIVTTAGLIMDEGTNWVWLESFDEVANALDALHVLDDEEAKARVAAGASPFPMTSEVLAEASAWTPAEIEVIRRIMETAALGPQEK